MGADVLHPDPVGYGSNCIAFFHRVAAIFQYCSQFLTHWLNKKH